MPQAEIRNKRSVRLLFFFAWNSRERARDLDDQQIVEVVAWYAMQKGLSVR